MRKSKQNTGKNVPFTEQLRQARSESKKKLYDTFSVPLRNRTELNSLLLSAYRTIENGGKVSDRVMSAIYDTLVDNSVVKDESWAEENREFVDYFKGLTLKIDDSVMQTGTCIFSTFLI